MNKLIRIFSYFLLASLLSCTCQEGMEHGYYAKKLEGKGPLLIKENDSDKFSGLMQLKREIAYDPQFEQFIKEKGNPDFIEMETNTRVKVYYLSKGQSFVFERNLMKVGSKLIEEKNLSEDEKKVLSNLKNFK